MHNRRNRKSGNVWLVLIIIGPIAVGSTAFVAQAEDHAPDQPKANRSQKVEIAESKSKSKSTSKSFQSKYDNKPISGATDPDLPAAESGPTEKAEPSDGPWYWMYYLLALGFVIFLIVAGAALFRKLHPGGRMFTSLPLIKVLGRTYLSPKQSLAMVKINQRVLILGLTEHHVSELLTISDPHEVSEIITEIEQRRPTGITGSFMQLFSNEQKGFSTEPSGLDLSDAASADSTESSTERENTEHEILGLKAELNSLINKVNRHKGIGS